MRCFSTALLRNGPLLAVWVLSAGLAVPAERETAWLPFEHTVAGTVSSDTGRPVSGAIVETVSDRLPTHRLIGKPDGRFLLRLKSDEKQPPLIRVSSPDGALVHLIPPAESAVRRVLRIILQPSREIAVRVTNSADVLLAGARVAAVIDGFPIASGDTGKFGLATLSLPADAGVDWIVAYKAGEGLDYYENYETSMPNSRRLQVPQRVHLKLDGSQSRTLKVMDSVGHPVSHVRVRPWNLWRFDKLKPIHLNRFPDVGVSDVNGLVTIAWLPATMPHRVRFSVQHPDYFWPRLDVPSDEIIQVERAGRISGIVRTPDGTPAGGIHLQAAGWHSWTGNSFRGHVVSDKTGYYELVTPANHDTFVTVTDRDWAAEPSLSMLLEPGENRQDIHFALKSGSLIRGTLRSTVDDRPLIDRQVSLTETRGNTVLIRMSEVNGEGQYWFRTSPGRYQLNNAFGDGPRGVDVFDEPFVEMDLHATPRSRKILVVNLVDSEDKPVSGGRIVGMPIRLRDGVGIPGHAAGIHPEERVRFRAACGEDGRFEVECPKVAVRLYGYQRGEYLAGTVRVDADATTATVQLLPAATVTGEVRDRNAQPIAKNPVQLSVELQFGDELMSCSFSGATDVAGRFQFPGVIPGATCRPYAAWILRGEHGSSYRTVAGDEQLISTPSEVELGPVTIKTLPLPTP